MDDSTAQNQKLEENYAYSDFNSLLESSKDSIEIKDNLKVNNAANDQNIQSNYLKDKFNEADDEKFSQDSKNESGDSIPHVSLANIELDKLTSKNLKTSKILDDDFFDSNDDDEIGDLDDFKLPEVDWVNLEAKLKQAQLEMNNQNKRNHFNNDRDEIRRKLAAVSSSSSSSSFNDTDKNSLANHDSSGFNGISDYMRKASIANVKSKYLGQNLQICFMNETNDEAFEGEENMSQPNVEANKYVSISELNSDMNKKIFNDGTCGDDKNEDLFGDKKLKSNYSSLTSSTSSTHKVETPYEQLVSIQTKLQNETKHALSQVQNQVKLKMEQESISIKKPSPIADIVGLRSYGLERLKREHIVDMNIGQLQVIVNDLCNQIEKTNEDLKKMLIDRDDLYMQQDSILVDIEDITKRIQEFSFKLKNANTSEIKNISNKSNSLPVTPIAAPSFLNKVTNQFSNYLINNKDLNSQSNSTNPSGIASTLMTTSATTTTNTTKTNQTPSTSGSPNPFRKSKFSFQFNSLTNKIYRFSKKS